MAKKKKKTAFKRRETVSPKLKKKGKKVFTKKVALLKPKKAAKPKKKKKREIKKGAGFSSNNFNHIRALLWKSHKQDFKGYSDPEFIRKVNAIYYDCKALDSDCTDDTILEKYNKIKIDERRPVPFIDPELFNPQIYYNIKDVEFENFASYLWIVSPMILPKPSEFLVVNYFDKIGDRTKGYNNTFREWVDWCNYAIRKEHGSMYGSDVVQMYFRFIPPIYNEILRRWESEIVICSPSGQIYDFGFQPKGKMFEHDIQKEYVQANEQILKEKPTTEQEQESMEMLRVKRANTSLRNALQDLTIKLKEKYRRVREQDLEFRLKEIEKRKKIVELYDKELNQILKSIKQLEKSAKLAKKMKDKKTYDKITKEILKATNKIITLNRKHKI
jgi:hypothetical protein